MKKLSTYLLIGLLFSSLSFTLTAQDWTKYNWDDVVDGDGLNNNFGSVEAIRIAENVLLYQRNVGGWPKNTQMQEILTDAEKAALIKAKPSMEGGYCTIDNSAVELELEYLSKVYKAIPDGPFREEVKKGFLLGIRYLLDMQYDNGGWPQFYPLRGGYSDHITYNDGAMIHAMNILRHIYQKDSEYSIIAADSACAAAKIAFEKGVAVILKTQIVQNGVLTAWCAQHHYETLAPAMARSYELPAIWGGESAGVARFLMTIDNPSFEIKRAVHSAANWFDRVRMIGQGFQSYINADGLSDRRIVYAPNAPDIWARCYSLENSTPFFCDRNGIPLYTHYDYNVVLSYDRRTGYSWFGGSGEDVLDDYTGWLAKWGNGMDQGVILDSPVDGTGYSEADSVIVKVFANTLVTGGVEKFELFLDQQAIREFASLEIDTLFTSLAPGKHTVLAKITVTEGDIYTDSSVIYVGSPLSVSVGDIIGEGMIKITPESDSYVENMEVTIQAVGAFPYGFMEWTDSLSGSVNPLVLTLDSDMVLGARFDTDSSSSLYINFQPESSPVPGGYLPDFGKQFASRGNGYSYGWLDGDNNEVRYRSSEADMRRATLSHMMNGSDTAVWEIELQNGSYAVDIHMGDAGYSDQINSIKVEDIEWVDSDGEDKFDEFYLGDVQVSDGKMTLKPIGDNAKINFIKIGFKGKTFGNYLAVKGGSGDGEYKEGEVVNITAESGSGNVFAYWIGDINHVENAFAANTGLLMPANDIALTAIFNPANTYTLTVNGGTGGGDFPHRDVVIIRADAAPAGKLFDQWTGDTEYITFVNEPYTTLSIPSRDISVTAVYKNDNTGINDLESGRKELHCYPNPANGSFSIDLTGMGDARIEIFNIYGQLMYSSLSNSQFYLVNDHGLGKGIYIIRVTDKTRNVYSQKLQVQ